MNSPRLLMVLLVAFGNTCQGQFLVVPNDLESNAGNASSKFPFYEDLFPDESVRYQQIYEANQFVAAAPRGCFITGIHFRNSSSTDVTMNDLQVSTSTSQRNIESLSLGFSDNVGNDETLVFVSTVYKLIGSRGFNPWTPTIKFNKPFFYDPRKGNLLLEIRNDNQSQPPPCLGCPGASLDGALRTNDPVARIYSTNQFSVVAESADTFGMVTGFDIVVSRLNVNHQTNGWFLSWSALFTNYIFQTSSNLAPPAAWSAVSSGILNDTTNKTYRLPVEGHQPGAFYRLFCPTCQ